MPSVSNRPNSGDIQKTLDGMKDKEHRYVEVGNHGDSVIIKRYGDLFAVGPESLRNSIASVGTAKQAADNLLRQVRGIVMTQDWEGGCERKTLSEKIAEIKLLIDRPIESYSLPKAQVKGGR